MNTPAYQAKAARLVDEWVKLGFLNEHGSEAVLGEVIDLVNWTVRDQARAKARTLPVDEEQEPFVGRAVEVHD